MGTEKLYINAWDPWSLVGNGHAGDASLDGYFGRSTPMALLCWPETNPSLQYVAVGDEVWTTLPEDVIPEAMVYLSEMQKPVCRLKPGLAKLADALPGWVPQRVVARAFNYSLQGLQKARVHLNGRPHVWATEFENVHDTWRFQEPTIDIKDMEGKSWVGADPEEYYQSQKRFFMSNGKLDVKRWNDHRAGIMAIVVNAKLDNSDTVRTLLEATGSHPLLSIKSDQYWGFDPKKGGKNMLAKLYDLRREIS